jgi:hypothetical protein
MEIEMSILEIIKPIELLSGSHSDAGKTGRGCLMNVVSYLNGDRTITDRPACACPVITHIAIYANDFFNDADRHLLLPFIPRIADSRTDDPREYARRAAACAKFASYAAKYAKYAATSTAKYAEYAAKYAESAAESAESAAKYAESAAKYAESAAKYAESAAESAAKYAAKYAALRDELITLLDDLCPAAIEESAYEGAARQYVELSMRA